MKKIMFLMFLLLCLTVGACRQPEPVPEVPTVTVTPTPIEQSEENVMKEEPVELTVYSQVSGFQGEQQGWFAKVLLDKFNVVLHIVPDLPEDEWKEKGTKGDILVFGSDGEVYRNAVAQGWLLDWEENDLMKKHGTYLAEHLHKALEYNRSLTPEAGGVYGFGHGAAADWEEIETILYYWDIRWDWYKKLGYPEVKNLEEFAAVLEKMQLLARAETVGKEVYALSFWREWDDTMVFYVRSMVSAYYGYDEFPFGFYDTETGGFHGALETEGPYLELLRFFNTLYRKGLLDPDSGTQTYEEALKKLENGEVLFSLFGYAGSMAYNTSPHLEDNMYMASLIPEESSPAADGMSVYGGRRIWAISADTPYPELCMELLNWFCTPEGRMVCEYGPQGLIWDYDAEGNTYFTEFGKTCYWNRETLLAGEYEGLCYGDGFPQINNVTWNINAENPDSNGETYNQESWKSNIPEASCAMEQDWREYTGAQTVWEYIKSRNYTVIPQIPYEETIPEEKLKQAWETVAARIVEGSWDAIYAESEEAFEKIVSEMQAEADACDYADCVAWCEKEAEKRWELEEKVRK
ncbi:MAG: extracellular solute-binding protein [Lachnospiraceae bacterium]|nr:extracellular solute-binding protein [Lachnospiraceae bacterium]